MGRSPCCEKMGLKKGPWTKEEDEILVDYINRHGHGNWRALPKQAGLLRCGKSCRLRWINYLRPDIKRGNFSREEEDTIIKLHQALGNRWSVIASRLPGRTDNEIKNIWHTRLKKRLNNQKHLHASRQFDDEYMPNDSNSSSHNPSTSSSFSITTSSSILSANESLISDLVLQFDNESFWSQTLSSSENSHEANENRTIVVDDSINCFEFKDNETYEIKSCIEFWRGLLSKADDTTLSHNMNYCVE